MKQSKQSKFNDRVAFWLPFVLVGVITVIVVVEGVKAYQWTGG